MSTIVLETKEQKAVAVATDLSEIVTCSLSSFLLAAIVL
jgi:hypothetical protein